MYRLAAGKPQQASPHNRGITGRQNGTEKGWGTVVEQWRNKAGGKQGSRAYSPQLMPLEAATKLEPKNLYFIFVMATKCLFISVKTVF